MNDKIITPYKFTKKEQALIDKRYLKAKDWDKKSLDSIKDNIRGHLRLQQDNTCCYCKRSFEFGILTVDIEHIVHKDAHPKFGFLSQNLALSCRRCNTLKKDKEVLVNPKRKSYPKSSESFRIVHPHFDNYSEHILKDGVVYKSNTPKGSWTIKECGLSTLSFAEQEMKEAITQRPEIGTNIINDGIYRLQFATLLPDDQKQEIINQLQSVIDNLISENHD